MRLIDKNDTSLAIALVASALVMFRQPRRILVDAARDVEIRYHIDLLSGLTVLVGTFAFHRYRKRQQARAAEAAASAEAAQARARSAELEQLVAFGRALGGALDQVGMRQVFWRYMPVFARERELWMLTRMADGWAGPVRDATAGTPRSGEELEAQATAALASGLDEATQAEGVLVGQDLCLPMIVGENPVGVVGVRNVPVVIHGGAARPRGRGAAARDLHSEQPAAGPDTRKQCARRPHGLLQQGICPRSPAAVASRAMDVSKSAKRLYHFVRPPGTI